MKKKRAITGGAIVVLVIAVIAAFSVQGLNTSRLAGDINGAATQEDKDSTTVFKTKNGNCFHVSGCSYLRSSAIPITYGQARAEGLEPCSRCGAYRWVNY